MTKIQALKFAAKLVVGSGTTTVTNSIIRNNVAPTNIFQQVSVGVTALVIGSMASHATIEHAYASIDKMASDWEAAKTKSETEKSETPTV